MNVLFDTNILIWALDSVGGKKFGPSAKRIVRDAEDVFVSSVSIFEIRVKAMIGKLEAPKNLIETVNSAGLKNLSLNADHAEGIVNFPALARHDPFDRMLLAQAKAEGLFLLTSDRFLIDQGFDFVLNARD